MEAPLKLEQPSVSSGYKYLSLPISERLSSKLIAPEPFFADKYSFKTDHGPKVSGYTSHVIHTPKHGHKGYGQSSVSFTMVHGGVQAPLYKQDYIQPVIAKVDTPVIPLQLDPGYQSEIIGKYDQNLSGGYGSLLTGSFGSILTNEYGGNNGLEYLYKKKK